MTTTDQPAAIEARASKQSAAYAKMLDLGGGVGELFIHHPDMYQDMQAWDDATENDHADTVLALIAMVREQAAKLDAVDHLAEKWERIPALRKGTAASDIRAALEATR